MARNPQLAPYIEDDPERRPAPAPGAEQQPYFTALEWQNVLGLSLYRLVTDDEDLPDAAQQRLEQLGVTRELILSQIYGGAIEQ
jgi:hypothetical protein